MNYPEAVQFTETFINYEKERSFSYPDDFKLDRMRRLAKELGNPQNAFECVQIAGSKGKGSTAAILSAILRMENYKVGLYTSPHLVEVRERIQVNGLLISPARFTEHVLSIRRVLDDPSWRKDPPTYFELLTALAFCHFREMKVHIAVLETGLGGLYDSTNIVQSKVVGLTPISLEHTDKLGKTISKIAVQKCGIIKGRETVVTAPQAKETENVIRGAADDRDATVLAVGRDIKIFERDHGESFQRFDLRAPFGNFFGLETPLRGAHQLENAAVAIGIAKSLEKKSRLPVSEAAVKQGLATAEWPGRLEKVGDVPRVLLDGAHNGDSAAKMIAGLKRHFDYRSLIVVLGVASDKDLGGILDAILPEATTLIVTSFHYPRATSVRALAEEVRHRGKEPLVEEDAWQALEKARSLATRDDIVLVAGSLYLVGEIKAGLTIQPI